ncbi:MAG TPA: TetR/AcrR family transcriptional regulator [Burkholderiaceae bacterium]|nr:TetR/AcrR family transcriptional regulator [Burkholderiaceae bacterium]
MGHSRVEKAKSHERIVKVAAAGFREAGVNGLGVADLMKRAGLTHGGFYRHFASRDELVAEAVERALKEGGEAMNTIANSKTATIGALIDAYLSPVHRDLLATSCAVTTLASDVARCNNRARSAYTAQVKRYLELFGNLLPGQARKGKRSSALLALSTLVGAVLMARAVNDQKLSREILKSAAEELKARLI